MNRYRLRSEIEGLLGRVLNQGFSAGKVDVVGHSMGGILARLHVQSPAYAEVYDSVNRLVTVNTPHSGSQMANLLKDRTSPGPEALAVLGIDGPAIDDLRVDHPAIDDFLNGSQNLNRNVVPVHAITTTLTVNEGYFELATQLGGFPTWGGPLLLLLSRLDEPPLSALFNNLLTMTLTMW